MTLTADPTAPAAYAWATPGASPLADLIAARDLLEAADGYVPEPELISPQEYDARAAAGLERAEAVRRATALEQAIRRTGLESAGTHARAARMANA